LGSAELGATVLCCAVLCCAVLFCAVPCCAALCHAAPCCAMLCCAPKENGSLLLLLNLSLTSVAPMSATIFCSHRMLNRHCLCPRCIGRNALANLLLPLTGELHSMPYMHMMHKGLTAMFQQPNPPLCVFWSELNRACHNCMCVLHLYNICSVCHGMQVAD